MNNAIPQRGQLAELAGDVLQEYVALVRLQWTGDRPHPHQEPPSRLRVRLAPQSNCLAQNNKSRPGGEATNCQIRLIRQETGRPTRPGARPGDHAPSRAYAAALRIEELQLRTQNG